MTATATTHQDQLDRFTATQAPTAAAARPTESRFAIVLDAIEKDKPFVLDAAGHYLTTLAGCFESFALEQPANGLLDTKVLAAIETWNPYFDEYKQFLLQVIQHAKAEDFVPVMHSFFDALLEYKNPGHTTSQQSYLWLDGYRYIIRELFLTTIAAFIRFEKYTAASALIDCRYNQVQNGAGDQSFVVFDAYVKTLDEFRNRRLRQQRLSASADLMRDRHHPTVCTFDEIMQADFILCLRALMGDGDFFRRWYPRTLVFADAHAQTGFDLFIMAASVDKFGPLGTLLDVGNRDELLARFEALCADWRLERWEIGGLPLDFRGFMGLKNPALTM